VFGLVTFQYQRSTAKVGGAFRKVVPDVPHFSEQMSSRLNRVSQYLSGSRCTHSASRTQHLKHYGEGRLPTIEC
jgi:hypothetical protein